MVLCSAQIQAEAAAAQEKSDVSWKIFVLSFLQLYMDATIKPVNLQFSVSYYVNEKWN
ncbi:hypothetical protein BRADI_3g42193v3 [Brachypodium distachyon]|uniref:Uncharacterized protein n=1 Tax=Brachypodium distachyon TaxID=15368 RepID=A0A2K2D2P4_BRADI|nr:hypothetical protein BRADI_3g42193v3 [Brachypodium distachyon]PNT68543.1 hypothetical protein BRADI_3g42193v3 [Brachypodium distachyon]PNT68544.1 hypothetical protein BRADI_3g42193v3 [Brachypodium distachyon]